MDIEKDKFNNEYEYNKALSIDPTKVLQNFSKYIIIFHYNSPDHVNDVEVNISCYMFLFFQAVVSSCLKFQDSQKSHEGCFLN